MIKDENHPIWATGFVKSNLVSIGKEFLKSNLSTDKYGFGYNILAVNNSLDISKYPLSVEYFDKVKFEDFLDNFIDNL